MIMHTRWSWPAARRSQTVAVLVIAFIGASLVLAPRTTAQAHDMSTCVHVHALLCLCSSARGPHGPSRQRPGPKPFPGQAQCMHTSVCARARVWWWWWWALCVCVCVRACVCVWGWRCKGHTLPAAPMSDAKLAARSKRPVCRRAQRRRSLWMGTRWRFWQLIRAARWTLLCPCCPPAHPQGNQDVCGPPLALAQALPWRGHRDGSRRCPERNEHGRGGPCRPVCHRGLQGCWGAVLARERHAARGVEEW